jgi:zona occludens toxin (predicted ATPase)
MKLKQWIVNTNLRGFTVGKIYDAFSENNFNVAIKNDDGEVLYVDKKYLAEVNDESQATS